MKRRTVLIFILLLLSGVFGCIKHQPQETVMVTGHRGASGIAPENTIASIVKAMELGADYSELDVQETADGIVVLLHDTTLDRTTNMKGNIWEVSYADLKDIDAGSWFAPEFKGEPIPTLEAIIDTVKDNMKLNIELKINSHEDQLVERVVELIKKKNFINNCILTSFDFNAVKKVRRLDKNIKVGYIFAEIPDDEDVFKADVDVLSVNKKIVDEDFVKKAHKHNKEVHVWTVNEVDEMKRLIDLGVDNIITNYPHVLRPMLQK